MRVSSLVLLSSLFVAPWVLLNLGHRLRAKRSRARRRFWGSVGGYLAGLLLSIGAMLLPPVAWAAEEGLRSFLVHGSPALGLILGFLVGSVFPVRGRTRE